MSLKISFMERFKSKGCLEIVVECFSSKGLKALGKEIQYNYVHYGSSGQLKLILTFLYRLINTK